jgi:glycosyltransferase involved in cell wall biosynthesis
VGLKMSELDPIDNVVTPRSEPHPRGTQNQRDSGQPVLSVVICAYNSRNRIDGPLRSLRAQDVGEPYEVIVVDSGSDGNRQYVRETYPEVRIIASTRRLRPGPARNRGVAAARGRFISFLPDDGVAKPDWLRRRLAKHLEGYEAVGGSIGNGTPRSAVGSAGYFVEYASVLPCHGVLRRQAIPHCLSYERTIFSQLGGFPENTHTGEDTVFNMRCRNAGVRFAFEPHAELLHCNLTRLGPYLRHQFEHGRGHVQCMLRYGWASRLSPSTDSSPLRALVEMCLIYPAARWMRILFLVAVGRWRCVPAYLVLSPLVWAGLWAASAGAWTEWRKARTTRCRK